MLRKGSLMGYIKTAVQEEKTNNKKAFDSAANAESFILGLVM